MLPDRVSNPGPLTYESGALPIALRGPASSEPQERKLQNISNSLSLAQIPSLRLADNICREAFIHR